AWEGGCSWLFGALSRVKWFAKRDVDVHRPGHRFGSCVDGVVDNSVYRPFVVGMSILLGKFYRCLDMGAEHPWLNDRLPIVLGTPFAWTLCCKHDQRYFAEVCFRDGGRKVVRSSSGCTYEHYRATELAGHSERDKSCTAFVAERAYRHAGLTRKGQRQWCTPRSRAEDHL